MVFLCLTRVPKISLPLAWLGFPGGASRHTSSVVAGAAAERRKPSEVHHLTVTVMELCYVTELWCVVRTCELNRSTFVSTLGRSLERSACGGLIF